MLEVQSLSVAYGDVRVLHDVSLRVGQGQIVSLVGANGAGKTTTLRAVSGLLPVLEGAVKFDGEPITGLAPFILAIAAGRLSACTISLPIMES